MKNLLALKSQRRERASTGSNRPRPTFNPLDMLTLISAVKKHLPRVRLSQREFTLLYRLDAFTLDTIEPGTEYVFVKPAKGFVPCGWFRVNKMEVED